jgi:hypothetical protein
MYSPANCALLAEWPQIADKMHLNSVLPPPPRYPSQAAYNLAVANGQATPMIETNNILKHPTGQEYQLVVGEGKAWRISNGFYC